MSRFSINALHILVLSNFAIAQPLLDILSRNVEFFFAHQSEPIDIIILVVAVCLLPPLFFILLQSAVRQISLAADRVLHFLLLGSLATASILPVVTKLVPISGIAQICVALVLGTLFAVAVSRYKPVRMFLNFLSPAIIVFPVLFLLQPTTFRIFFPLEGSTVPVKVASTTPVILVVFDEFSVTSLLDENNTIDPVRYPHFESLAGEAYWFRNATTVSDDTIKGAIPTILTGVYPDDPLAEDSSTSPGNLFTLLGGSYDLVVHEPYTKLCPDFLCPQEARFGKRLASLFSDLSLVYIHILLPPSITSTLPQISHDWKNFWPRTMKRQDLLAQLGFVGRDIAFQRFVDSIGMQKNPALYFLHILLPHVPWAYLPNRETYDARVGFFGVPGLHSSEKWSDDTWAVKQGHQRYLLQLGFVDQLVGDLIGKMKSVGIYDASLLIITADHGVSFRESDSRRQISKSNYVEIIHVPLFIKLPHMKVGVMSDRNVESIDILPTIADILKIPMPWRTDSVSMLDSGKSVRENKTVYLQNRKEVAEKIIIPDLGLEEIAPVVARKVGVFGSGSGVDKLLTIGPHNHLIGKDVHELDVRNQGRLRLQMIRDARVTKVSDIFSDDSVLPVSGSLYFEDAGMTRRPDIAIAVNGKIASVTKPYFVHSQQAEFSSFIPGSFLRAGENVLGVFVVSGTMENPYLERLTGD